MASNSSPLCIPLACVILTVDCTILSRRLSSNCCVFIAFADNVLDNKVIAVKTPYKVFCPLDAAFFTTSAINLQDLFPNLFLTLFNVLFNGSLNF